MARETFRESVPVLTTDVCTKNQIPNANITLVICRYIFFDFDCLYTDDHEHLDLLCVFHWLSRFGAVHWHFRVQREAIRTALLKLPQIIIPI